jgi:dihydroxy-acid dehydratase
LGGPIGLLKNGDIIVIDAIKGRLSVELSDKELAKRRKAWKPKKNFYASGALWKYAQLVGPAVDGAVTHPGARKERHVFADI